MDHEKTANRLFTTKRKKKIAEKWDRQVENLAFCSQRAAELTDQPFLFFFSLKQHIITIKRRDLQQVMSELLTFHRDMGIAHIDNLQGSAASLQWRMEGTNPPSH